MILLWSPLSWIHPFSFFRFFCLQFLDDVDSLVTFYLYSFLFFFITPLPVREPPVMYGVTGLGALQRIKT